jgi:hypothetical protein
MELALEDSLIMLNTIYKELLGSTTPIKRDREFDNILLNVVKRRKCEVQIILPHESEIKNIPSHVNDIIKKATQHVSKKDLHLVFF